MRYLGSRGVVLVVLLLMGICYRYGEEFQWLARLLFLIAMGLYPWAWFHPTLGKWGPRPSFEPGAELEAADNTGRALLILLASTGIVFGLHQFPLVREPTVSRPILILIWLPALVVAYFSWQSPWRKRGVPMPKPLRLSQSILFFLLYIPMALLCWNGLFDLRPSVTRSALVKRKSEWSGIKGRRTYYFDLELEDSSQLVRDIKVTPEIWQRTNVGGKVSVDLHDGSFGLQWLRLKPGGGAK